MSFLPYGHQCISEADIEAVTRILRSDWLTQGPVVEEFEKKLSHATGAAHVVSCNSGTAALHLAAMAAGLKEGDAAIVPAITFIATANAVRMTGADVIFADVDPQTGRMTPQTLDRAFAAGGHMQSKIRAVLPVHMGGEPCAMPEIAALCAARGAIVIEDACHALGGSYRNGTSRQAKVGACADSAMACFSFHPVKPITTGEGGAVTTNDAALAARMRSLRNHGMTRDAATFRNREQALDADSESNPWYYEMHEVGWNYRLNDIQAALGAAQLARLDEFRNARAALVQHYRELLVPLSPTVQTVPETRSFISGHHLFPVLIDFEALGMTRASVMKELRVRGIGTQVHYIPVPWQPYYTARYGKHDYPGAASYYARCLSLPLFAAMNETQVRRVVDSLADVLRRA
jgi:UDP-4-amino-4,6-dideoxy-N-acetyl-beta-L-altrosamine transaminase